MLSKDLRKINQYFSTINAVLCNRQYYFETEYLIATFQCAGAFVFGRNAPDNLQPEAMHGFIFFRSRNMILLNFQVSSYGIAYYNVQIAVILCDVKPYFSFVCVFNTADRLDGIGKPVGADRDNVTDIDG